jgi:hypothetical protein
LNTWCRAPAPNPASGFTRVATAGRGMAMTCWDEYGVADTLLDGVRLHSVPIKESPLHRLGDPALLVMHRVVSRLLSAVRMRVAVHLLHHFAHLRVRTRAHLLRAAGRHRRRGDSALRSATGLPPPGRHSARGST